MMHSRELPITAENFEEVLINNGGYKKSGIPWYMELLLSDLLITISNTHDKKMYSARNYIESINTNDFNEFLSF